MRNQRFLSVLRVACLLLILLSETLAAQSIALMADLNGRYGSTHYDVRVADAVANIVDLRPDLVICAGDMVAGQKQPWLDEHRLALMWQGFNHVVTDPLRRAGISLAVTAGNHDGSAFPEFERERQQFELQWRVRVPEVDILPGSEWPRRYAARLGAVLLLTFDGTRPGPLPETELEFVKNMLRQYGFAATVTIVFAHLPMWPLAAGREDDIIDDPALLDLLHQSGVDVYASGHHHVFYAGTDSAGMLHLGLGALGGNARRFSSGGRRQPHSFAILELAAGAIGVASRAAPDFQSDVSAAKLPLAINGPLGVLQRVDAPVRLRR